jgi:hypothetical protein
VGIIDASPFDADSAYVAIDRHRLDDQKPYIYRTHDGGKSWQKIVTGLEQDQSVNVVRADPMRSGLLFAGTERGLFMSLDDGKRWQPLQQNLPATSVRDITIHGNDIVIATHGRGIWILDDISALRQLDAKVENAAAWLYAPAPAYRMHTPQFTGTPLPKDEPAAPNPALGAYIDYTLQTPAKSPVTLDIFDANQALVRHYSSADQPPAPDAKKSSIALDWVEHPITLSAAAGMHRFVWPLRYRGVQTDKDAYPAYIDGVWVPPGNYRVELSVDGRRLTQTLTVLADPRIDLPAQAYAQQFALATRIDAQRTRVAAVSMQIEGALEALAKARVNVPTLAHDIDAVARRLRDVSGLHAAANPHNAWAFPPGSTHTVMFVSSELDDLALAVDGADAAPSPDAQRGVEALLPMIEATLKAWDELKAHELAALNAKLKAAGKAEIKVP